MLQIVMLFSTMHCRGNNYFTYAIPIILQTATGKQLSIVKHISEVWKREGLKSLFAGNGANCIRVLPFSALVCVAYSNMAKVCMYLIH